MFFTPADTNRTRLVRKAHPTESFFNFFTPPVPPADEDLENEDLEEDEYEAIEEKLEMDYQIGEDLKEKVTMPFSSSRAKQLMTFLFFFLPLPPRSSPVQ